MTSRRVAALAQALAIVSTLLVPGLQPGGPVAARAAVAPTEPSADQVFDATDDLLQCPSDTKFKGPRQPGDPPWPPGAKPEPSPTPSDGSAPLDPAASPAALGGGATMLLANTDVRVAQADPAPETTPESGGGASKVVAGIDVSHHNNVDFEKVRASNKHFVYMKATESDDHLDTKFLDFYPAAKAAGLAVGAYHVFDYTLDGKVQADHFVDRLEVVDALAGSLPHVIDVECWPYRGGSVHAIAETRLRDFVKRFYERTARLPVVYASPRSWEQVVGNPGGFEDLPLWVACWGCQAPPTLASGWDTWVFWQTGLTRIRGLGNRLDGNVFSGTKSDLEAMKLRPLTIAEGAAVTGRRRVEVDLGGRDGSHLRTSLDGEQWSAWTPVRPTVHATLGPEEGEQTLHVQLRARQGTKSPVFQDSVTLDLSGPEVDGLVVKLREGGLGDGASVPVTVAWTARDETAGLTDAVVAVSCAEGRARHVDAPGSAEPGVRAAWDVAATMLPGASCDVTATSRDGVGNATRRSVGAQATVVPARDAAASVQGHQVGVIAQRGPEAGRAALMLDGQAVGLIDLYAPENSGPEVVHVLDLQPGTSHQVELAGTGTSDPESRGTAVVVDGFVTLSPSG